MALRTMGFPGMKGANTITPQDICTVGYYFEMVWVNTHAVATKVVDLEAMRDRPN